MKRMIDDMKSNPDLIYKRLCVRYGDETIARGKVKMEETMGRVQCGARRVSDATEPGKKTSDR